MLVESPRRNAVTREPARLSGDEAGLILAAQSGDRDAFASLVEHYWDRLYRWLCRMTRDPHAAEDLAQESFLKAFGAIGTFQAGSNFRAWLFRIAQNNFINQRRAARRLALPFPDDVPETDLGPPEETLSREGLAALARAIGKLPRDFRAAMILRAEEDLSFKEIGEILGITEQTARWRVFKARQKLLAILEPEFQPPTTQSHRKPT